jgi:perosamine synthetase
LSKLALLGGEKVRKKPFPPHPVFGQEEKDNVLKVLESGMLSGFVAKSGDVFYGGPYIKELEINFKNYFNVKHAIAVNSATAGLHAAIAAARIGPGDEVIVTPYTMSASASCILMQNAIPVFADIREDTFCIDPEKIKQAITPSTKAIVVVHLFGQAADMDEIMTISRENNLIVIEDVAQAPGGAYKDKLLGTIGDIGIFSLNQHKTITTGEGGVIITTNDDYALRMQLVRNHGEVIVASMGLEDITNILGWNYRMTELEAAVGVAQFQKLNFLNEYRISLAEHLDKKLINFHPAIIPPVR